MRRLFLVLVLCAVLFLSFSASVCAEKGEAEAPEIDVEIPEGVKEYISPELYSADTDAILSAFTLGNAVKTAISLLDKVFPEAMEAFLGLLGLIVISAVMAALRESVASPAFGSFLEFVSVLCIASAAFVFVEELFAEFETFVSQVNAFMVAVIPALSALMLSGGEVTSSLVFGGVLSGAVTFLEVICTSLVLPMLSALLCVYTTAKVCGEVELGGFARLIKSAVTYTLTACIVIMCCVLAFQGVIAKSADTAAVKGVKFVLGNAVPVVGGALADAVGTLASSVGLLKSTVGIVSAAVICVIFALPVLKFIVWKCVFDACGAVAAALSLRKESAFFAEMSEIVGFLAAITASTAVFFIIALTAATAA